MAQLKAHEIDRFLKSGRPKQRVFLVYGPDRGLVSERAAKLAELSGVDLNDPFSVIKLDSSDLSGDPGRLADEANAIGLFGGDRLVWLRGAGNDKSTATAVGLLASEPPDACTVIVEAGDLKKGAALRKAVENASGGMALPCFQDEARAVNALIDEELAAANLRIEQDARQFLISILGGDRLASRNELRKLTLYCMDAGTITMDDVIAAVGDAAAISIDDAVDAVLNGNLTALQQTVRRLSVSRTGLQPVLIACLRQAQQLAALHGMMTADRMSPSQAVAKLGWQVHFRRKPLIEKALSRTTPRLVEQISARLQDAILQSRQSPGLADAVANQALIGIGLRMARGRI